MDISLSGGISSQQIVCGLWVQEITLGKPYVFNKPRDTANVFVKVQKRTHVFWNPDQNNFMEPFQSLVSYLSQIVFNIFQRFVFLDFGRVDASNWATIWRKETLKGFSSFYGIYGNLFEEATQPQKPW